MKILWQCQSITAIGDTAIIDRVNQSLEEKYLLALQIVNAGQKTVTSIDDAINQIQNSGQGIVSDYKGNDNDRLGVIIHKVRAENLGLSWHETEERAREILKKFKSGLATDDGEIERFEV